MSEQPDKDPGPIPSEEQWAGRAVQDDGLPTRDELAEAIFESGVRQTMSQSEQAADNILAELRILRAAPPLHDPQEPER